MKRIHKYLVVAAIAITSGLQAQDTAGKTNGDTTIQYFTRLAASGAADKAVLQTKLYTLLQSNKESDWLLAQRFFYQLKNTAVSDSIMKAVALKFPEGTVVRGNELTAVYETTGAVKKEAAFKSWFAKFPPAKYGSDRIVYDYARNSVSAEFAREGNVKKALEYTNAIETDLWKGEGFAGLAGILIKNNQNLGEAEALLKKAIANSYEFMTTRKNDVGAGFAATGYLGYHNMLAEALYKQKKYTAALPFAKKAHDDNKTVKGYINANYSKILIALNKNQEAFAIIDEAVRAGQATEEMKKDIKLLYIKVNGNDGYDAYMDKLNKELIAKMLKDLPRQMINEKAPLFTLNDLEGNTVSLASLKGKVVIVDFWATWCGPCKASFPAMQTAVDKYKKDPDVKFLFVHTWERTDTTPTINARKYIQDMKYPFQVLMDLQDKETGSNKVIESYKVTGIPTKFVIDKNGNIRFKLTGFSGGNDAAVEEVSAMIELARS